MTEDKIEKLIEELNSEDEFEAIEALAEIGDPAVSNIVEAFKKGQLNALTTLDILERIGSYNSDKIPPNVIDAIVTLDIDIDNISYENGSHGYDIAEGVLQLLGDSGDLRAPGILRNCSRDGLVMTAYGNLWGWVHCCEGTDKVNSIEYDETLEYLIDKLGLDEGGPESFKGVGEKVILALIEVLEKREGGDWPDFVIRILGEIGDKRAIEPITKFLNKNKDWEEVQDAGKEALKKLE